MERGFNGKNAWQRFTLTDARDEDEEINNEWSDGATVTIDVDLNNDLDFLDTSETGRDWR